MAYVMQLNWDRNIKHAATDRSLPKSLPKYSFSSLIQRIIDEIYLI